MHPSDEFWVRRLNNVNYSWARDRVRWMEENGRLVEAIEKIKVLMDSDGWYARPQIDDSRAKVTAICDAALAEPSSSSA